MNAVTKHNLTRSAFWAIILGAVEFLMILTKAVKRKFARKSEKDEPFPDEAPH